MTSTHLPRPDTRTDFSGLWIPLITPLRDGRPHLPTSAALARRLRADGATGLVVCGSTAEAAALEPIEQKAVLSAVLEAVPGMPVAMGVSGYHLPRTQEWIRELADQPLAALLVSAPHYIRPAQRGLVDWFTALADAATVPLIVYDIPYRTGVTLERHTLLELATHPRIQAVKDCAGDLAKTLALIADGRLQVLAGEDLQLFSTLCQGGVGAIAASAHWQTDRFADVVALLRNGQLDAARAIWAPLVPWIEAAFAEPNPAPVKAMLALDGAIENSLRAPMTACSPELMDRLQRLHRQMSGRRWAAAVAG